VALAAGFVDGFQIAGVGDKSCVRLFLLFGRIVTFVAFRTRHCMDWVHLSVRFVARDTFTCIFAGLSLFLMGRITPPGWIEGLFGRDLLGQ
jgi:hypothetical protein